MQSTVLAALRPVRGPVRFLDLPPVVPFLTQSLTQSLMKEQSLNPLLLQMRMRQRMLRPLFLKCRELRSRNHFISVPTAAADETEKSMRERREKRASTEVRDEAEEAAKALKSEKTEVAEVREERSSSSRRNEPRSPPARDEPALAFQSYNMARKLDVLPPVEEDNTAFQRYLDVVEPVDEELIAETFSELKLTTEEKAEFDATKDAALMVWIENAAWRAVPEEEAGEGEVIPARFQRWKPTKEGKRANARVSIQGFRHTDVVTEALLKEPPTLSRTGRMLIMVWAVRHKWSLWRQLSAFHKVQLSLAFCRSINKPMVKDTLEANKCLQILERSGAKLLYEDQLALPSQRASSWGLQ